MRNVKKLPGRKKTAPLPALLLILCSLAAASCGDMYGTLGGADITDTYRKPEEIAGLIDRWQGMWYSRFGSRLMDGYTVGKWKEIKSVLGGKAKLFLYSGFDPGHPRFITASGNVAAAVPSADGTRGESGTIHDEDYFMFYDDSVYRQNLNVTDNSDKGYSWIGIIRAVNIFDHDPNRGAVIVEYLDGCYPERAPFLDGLRPLPFYGIYFRLLDEDTIQFANPIDLAARINGQPYHTERATLEEAVALNNVENDIEFIDWGEALPHGREGCGN
jgi:hypothetical protein